MEKLKILIGPGGKIPVTKYGGIERIVWNLGKELAAMGHQVTFLANAGSHCDFASIIEYDPKRKLSKQMAENYLLLYEKVMNGQKLNSTPPRLLDPDNIDKLPLFD